VDPDHPLPNYPLDDLLRMNHAQSVGTHNSYHVDTWDGAVPQWEYSHPPLDEQLGDLGVRQFELDVYWRQTRPETNPEGRFDVLHVPAIDATTTCASFRECLQAQKGWSDDHPEHLPFLTLIETKSSPSSDGLADRMIAELDEEISAVWPRDRLVTPADIQGDQPDLRTAVGRPGSEGGWPLLGAVRGRAVYVLHSGGRARAALLRQPSADSLMVPDAGGDADAPFAAFHAVNDPDSGGALIAELVRRGHMVRTRADVDGDDARANDTSRLQTALASGAHYISTDFPKPHPVTGYVVQMPGGTPSRCNPRSAPEACTSDALEDGR
jgi:hypothetical protein